MKRPLTYARFGVREYWVVDLDKRAGRELRHLDRELLAERLLP